ncbi:speckle-type POZ protein [Nephila pilipes]|uniref:Speckle-type POZ protein n=1 Tax=Nephila pilipes TaxID=299642 RepID=A0A8X6UT58_NEPPI|nr:speckle-type POZ protein [Nephila pilipes]
MANEVNNEVNNYRRRGFLQLEATSRSVLWTVDNYYSVLATEHSICSNTFRVPSLFSCLFYLSLSVNEDVFSLNVIRTAKSPYFLRAAFHSSVKACVILKDTFNSIQLSREFIISKDNISEPINFSKDNNSCKISNEANLEVKCTIIVSETENSRSCHKMKTPHACEKDYVPSISTDELKNHLQVILEGDEDNHVTIFVDDDVFQVHRTILCSNSPVFSAMFEHDTSEKTKSQIYIDDISAETIGEILSFMYFGSTSKLSRQKAIDVYSAADKYAIMNLKGKCSNFLVSNLTQELVLDVLIMADRHGDEELKELAIKFLVNEAANIIKSDEFLLFVETEPNLGRCIISHLLKLMPR